MPGSACTDQLVVPVRVVVPSSVLMPTPLIPITAPSTPVPVKVWPLLMISPRFAGEVKVGAVLVA